MKSDWELYCTGQEVRISTSGPNPTLTGGAPISAYSTVSAILSVRDGSKQS